MAKRPISRSSSDAAIAQAIEGWFAANARSLPWREETLVVDGIPRRNPYHSLVSELMLQQTQVSRVIERFQAFIARFPTPQTLAQAQEDEVLSLWSGLGYYRRARHLHAAARRLVTQFGGVFPTEPAALRQLPGVGAYTAGAIASLALGQREPVVDGNVARVLLRLAARRAHSGEKSAEAWAWARARRLVGVAQSPGRLNEGLMELGALVCTPAAPKCDACPLSRWCRARAHALQGSIPAPKPAPARRPLFCASVLIRDAHGRVAVQRRGSQGMWAGLWQAPTLERSDRAATASELRRWITGGAPGTRGRLRRLESFPHRTTHREVTFQVWRWLASTSVPPAGDWEWIEVPRLATLGLSNAQRRILAGSRHEPEPV